MTFAYWQQLTPAAAAREVHARVRERLSPGQQQATIAQLDTEPELTVAFERAAPAAPLGHVPCFVKDLFDVAGRPTFAGSTFLPEVRPTPRADSALVAAVREAGAVVAGKSQLHEFAYGITGENPHYGDAEHPHFPGRTAGGSSSGSAALVAAGVCPLAFGTDTGGSVRLPAAFCGLYGFRLTPGHAWIRDAIALSPSLDTAGWFTRTGEDMRRAMTALVGLAVAPVTTPRGCYVEMPGLDAEVAQACRQAASHHAATVDEEVGNELRSGFAPLLDAYNVIVAQEAWAVHLPWAEKYRNRYDPAVWQRLKRAQSVTPAQHESAARAQSRLRELLTVFFRSYDFLILPASPAAAFTKAECTLDNRNRILLLTAPASLAGLPVLTVPIPLPSGLTTGLQIIVNEPRSPVIPWVLERTA
jgi:aspartyl-tRNA(Asn)/glutamyl-tRNA(Gln) amidotransferase subunit A